MANRKKFRIANLKSHKAFAASRDVVLSHYLKRVLKHAEKYQRNNSVEGLHKLRIALRRFRYVFELYAPLVKKRQFDEVYALAVELQNVLGQRRDIDVMQERLVSIYRVGVTELPPLIAADIEQSKALYDTQIEQILHDFMRNKQVRKLAV